MMENLPSRKSIRLKKYNYSSSGYYYVTICTKDRKCVFGDIVDGKMILNDVGKMINKWYLKIQKRFNNISLDQYQIMPNHMHGIVVINNGRTRGRNGQTRGSAPTNQTTVNITTAVGVDTCVNLNDTCVNLPSLSKIIQWFKTMTTNNYIHNVKNNNWKPFNKYIWQRGYYEHIVRNQHSLKNIRLYIKNNPMLWHRDRNNLKNWKSPFS